MFAQDEKPTVFLAVKITPSQRRELENVVRMEGTSFSELTRRALADYLARRAWQVFAPGVMADDTAPREEVR